MSVPSRLYAVILAGGSGTRFWPLSRELYPKQLLKVLTEQTLLQETVLRVKPLIPAERIMVVTGAHQAEAVRFQLGGEIGVPKDNILIEPIGRNTAPAIGWAAEAIHRKDPHATMLVMPSDHIIPESPAFLQAVELAAEVAQDHWLVTFGIKPSRPESGYGYIEAEPNRPVGSRSGLTAVAVTRFVEKPDVATAKGYVESGRFYWNSGIFIWRADTILKEMHDSMPLLATGLARLGPLLGTSEEARGIEEFYQASESISIDYGIMQKTRWAAVIPAPFRWSDIGSWSSLEEVASKDEAGNVCIGPIVNLGSRDSIFYAQQRLVATIGLQDMVVVDTADATLVCPKDRTQDVKQIVELLRQRGAPEQLIHRTVQRPWGSYTVLEEGPGYKVKRVTVNPRGRLSLQLHHKRSEHWVVTSGSARVTCNDRVFDLTVNESTLIPQGVAHRLENPGDTILHLIETQCGEYVGEDDIVRLADDYGRSR